MAQLNVCAQPNSTTIAELIMDWEDHCQLLLNQIETDIFEHNEPNVFAPEYVKLCAGRMIAKYQLNPPPPCGLAYIYTLCNYWHIKKHVG